MEIKSNKFHRDYKKKELLRLNATDERYPDGSERNRNNCFIIFNMYHFQKYQRRN